MGHCVWNNRSTEFTVAVPGMRLHVPCSLVLAAWGYKNKGHECVYVIWWGVPLFYFRMLKRIWEFYLLYLISYLLYLIDYNIEVSIHNFCLYIETIVELLINIVVEKFKNKALFTSPSCLMLKGCSIGICQVHSDLWTYSAHAPGVCYHQRWCEDSLRLGTHGMINRPNCHYEANYNSK